MPSLELCLAFCGRYGSINIWTSGQEMEAKGGTFTEGDKVLCATIAGVNC